MGCICVFKKKIINCKLIKKPSFFKFSIDNNIWKNIFLYLNKEDLIKVSMINKSFYNIINEINYESEEKTKLTLNDNIKTKNEEKERIKIKNKEKESIKIKNKEKESIKIKNEEKERKEEKEKIIINQNEEVYDIKKNINPILITKAEVSKNNNDKPTYIDLFTYMKITINSNQIKNEQNIGSSINSSISYNNKTPSFSEEGSIHKSLINYSNVSNNLNLNRLSKFNNLSKEEKNNLIENDNHKG